MSKTKTRPSRVVRRSFAISADLLKEADDLAPAPIRGNANRIVRTALEEFVANRRRAAFRESLARMACDPAILRESAAMTQDFLEAESDGLPS